MVWRQLLAKQESGTISQEMQEGRHLSAREVGVVVADGGFATVQAAVDAGDFTAAMAAMDPLTSIQNLPYKTSHTKPPIQITATLPY